MPFASLFHGVLKSGEDILDRDLRFQNTILHATIFSIEKHCLVGGILQDITKPAVRKEQVIRKAREVIQKQSGHHSADRLSARRKRGGSGNHAEFHH